MKKRKYKTLWLPIDFWFFSSLFLAIILLIFSLLLIKERQFLSVMEIYLSKYKVKMNGLSNFNARIVNSHLSLTTNPSSSSDFIYIFPESFSLKLNPTY